MRIHHLSCLEMRPPGGSFIFGRHAAHHHLVCHCLLLETDRTLVLVDCGVSLADIAEPRRLGRGFLAATRPVLDPQQTAVRQVARLGFDPTDVRHIIVTHMDVDHAGGLSDFPHAKVHLLQAELERARAQATMADRNRYRAIHFAHDPDFCPYDGSGEPWFGFESVRDLAGLPPEILLVPLPGHSDGHTAVAIARTGGYLMHCGDAYFHRGEVHARQPRCPPGLRLFQSVVEADRSLRLHNQKRLRALTAEHGDTVEVVCAHDPVEFDRARARA